MGVGAHSPNCKADGANCKKNYVWLTNYVQNWGVSCATFCGAGVGWTVALRCNVFSTKKRPSGTEGLCIHDGGDEGDRTPDLLTASQALSQLSYAPVTWRYYRGRSSGMQGLFWLILALTGFPGAKIITLRAIIFIRRPDKTLMEQIRYCDALVDLDLGRFPDDIRDACVG